MSKRAPIPTQSDTPPFAKGDRVETRYPRIKADDYTEWTVLSVVRDPLTGSGWRVAVEREPGLDEHPAMFERGIDAGWFRKVEGS